MDLKKISIKVKKRYDAVVIGAGIVGLSTAYYLSGRGLKVLIVEKNYPASGSTGRCIGGIRMQFSTETSIRLMQESMSLFENMEKEFGFSVEFYKGGYLFLAHSEKKLEAFKSVSILQKGLGLNVKILSPAECAGFVPGLNITGLKGGVYSPDDGQAYPFKVTKGYISGIKKRGSDLRLYTEVTELNVAGNEVRGIILASGEEINSDTVINTAGPYARDIGLMAGLDLPIYPEEHEALITDRHEHKFDPMLVDYRPDGCYFQQMVTGQIIGCYTPVPNKPGRVTESTSEFIIEMSKRTLRLVPDLGTLKVLRHWGGSYSMTPDGSPIIDHTPLRGFFVAVGMSGHGFMFGPAAGKYLSDIIVDDNYPFDWTEFKLDRNFSRKEVMK